MISRKNIARFGHDPGLVMVVARRWLPWAARRRDPECRHLIEAWSSGSAPRVDFVSLFPSVDDIDVALRKPEHRVVGWSLDLQELVRLLVILKATAANKVLEIGTYDGFTALNIAANLPDGGEVATLDLPQDGDEAALRAGGLSNAITSGIVGEKFRNEPEAAKIRQIWGNSAEIDWTSFGGPFDMIFIDGSHDYKYVKSDSLKAIQHVRPGGTILWHDYGQAVDVSRAVDEIAQTYPVKAILGTRFACLRMP